jgi:hypothetical protein
MKVASHDLPPEKFPIVIEALDVVTRAVVWSATIEQPPHGEKAVVAIPSLSQRFGHPVAIRLTFGDGEVEECGPAVQADRVMLVITDRYIVAEDELGHLYIVCRKCEVRSYHPRDILERYCGSCHVYHDDQRIV